MAFRGAGSALRVLDTSLSPDAYVTIANVITITGPQQTQDEFETTDLASTAREFLPALKDNGSVDFEAHFDPANAQHQALFSDAGDGTTRTYRIQWDNASPDSFVTFTAFVASLSNETPPNDSVKLNGSLRITGDITTSW